MTDVDFNEVSSDWSNASHSWTRTSVFTVNDVGLVPLRSRPEYESGKQLATVRVEIRANAYERQSHATVSVWSDGEGWMFHTSIPTEQWYADCPSYTRTRDRWKPGVVEHYDTIEHELLSRLAAALYGGGMEIIRHA